jgi:hypothetical protein
MLDSSLWHARLYQWIRWQLMFLLKGTESWRKPSFLDSTNTCIYLRTLLVYLPMILLIRFLVIVGPLFALFYFPLTMFGGSGLINVILVLVGAGFLLGFAMVGSTMLIHGVIKSKDLITAGVEAALENCRDPQRISFCSIMIKCWSDLHSKVCTHYQIGGSK